MIGDIDKVIKLLMGILVVEEDLPDFCVRRSIMS